MAQQTLHTVVTLGGHVDNSFGKIGDALVNIGSQVNLVSQKIIGFGKDSVETYVKYDDLMREVQAVGEFTNAEVKALDEINSEIAKTSVYSNIQAAEAEVIMGQYGMGIADIKSMLPDVLDLAMAGNIEIKDSIDYLYSSLMSLGEGVGYAGVLTDQMAKTAAIGATDVDTLGDSLMRLGSGAQMFKGGSAEILTILTAMSQFGADQRGAAAGTWIRNFMLSLAAPAGNIDDIVDAMEQLGVAEQEIEEYADAHRTGASQAAVNSLVEDGLRVYDDAGQLLPAMEIIKSLRDTVRGSGEYADDLGELTGALASSGNDIEAFMASTEGLTDNALYGVFRQIFGRRGISTALNLISVSDEEWNQYWTDIVNSEGFAESMAETMQGGLGGALRELEASWGEFKTTFGETIAPVVEDVADWLHDIVVSLSEMDANGMSVLVSWLTAIAALGPGLMLAGGALKLIGFFMTTPGKIALGIAGLTALTLYLTQFAETEWKGNFGTLELDLQSLQTHADGVKTKFDDITTELSEFDTAIATSAENYQNLTSAFSSDLITAVLTNKELTEADKTALMGYSENIIGAIKDGITLKKGEALQLTDILFGDMQTLEEEEVFKKIVGWESFYLDGLYEEAGAVGQNLRDALTAALQDGSLDEGDRMAIQAQVDRLNEIQAQIANRLDRQDYYTQLSKAQRVSWDSFDEHLSGLQADYEEKLNSVDDLMDEKYGFVMSAWESNYEQGLATTEDSDKAEAALLREEEELKSAEADKFGEFARASFDTLMNGSEYSDAWKFLRKVYADGAPTKDGHGGYDFGDRDWSKYFTNGQIPTLEQSEDPNSLYNQLYAMWRAQKGVSGTEGNLTKSLEPYKAVPQVAEIFNMLDTALDASNYTYTISPEQAAELPNHEASGLLVREDVTIGVDANTSGAEESIGQLGNVQVPIDIVAKTAEGGADSLADLEAQGVDISVTGDTTELSATIDAEDGQTLLEYISGDATDLALSITSQDGQTLTENVTGNAASLAAVIASYNGQTITVNIRGRKLFAAGGRANEASIFGEAGPEWAIPEEHSERTASLLDAAREASGFTWPELIARNGGLNANPGRAPTQIIYSPTIYANDAQGVDEKLKEDKERLDKWWSEKQLHDEVEVYS